VGPKSIVIWQGEGLPFKIAENGKSNEYNTAEVIRWMIKREQAAAGSFNLSDERANLAREQAEYARLKNEERKGNLLPLDLVVTAVQKAAVAIRQKIVNSPLSVDDKSKLLEEIHALGSIRMEDIKDAEFTDDEEDPITETPTPAS
jgi:phage terminase Nu1 subunit (DNA packaging protein)